MGTRKKRCVSLYRYYFLSILSKSATMSLVSLSLDINSLNDLGFTLKEKKEKKIKIVKENRKLFF